MLTNHSLLSSDSLLFENPIVWSWVVLLFKPLLWYIWISSQSPIVVVATNKSIYIVSDKQQNDIYKWSMREIGCSDTKKLHAIEHSVEALTPTFTSNKRPLGLCSPLMNRTLFGVLCFWWNLRLTCLKWIFCLAFIIHLIWFKNYKWSYQNLIK